MGWCNSARGFVPLSPLARVAQPAGSRFESAPQKAVEASRTLINDVAAMPSALGGMMGTAGLGMMGNAMAGYARSLQPNPVTASGFM